MKHGKQNQKQMHLPIQSKALAARRDGFWRTLTLKKKSAVELQGMA